MDRNWADITDWEDELKPALDQAKRMLGVTTYDRITPTDEVLRRVAVDLGIPERWHPTEVGLVLGDHPGAAVPDPYFGGAGPDRNACTHCGECMTGCRHNAKNTLVKNYLHLAEKAGAAIHELTTVTDVRPIKGGGYAITAHRSGRFPRKNVTFAADQVIFAAAALGTQRLLHRLRDRGSLSELSSRLGELTRTNSESGVTVRSRGNGVDYSHGAAITCSLHLDDHTHVEPCRYGQGSNAISLGTAILADPEPGRSRLALTVREMWRSRRDLPRLHRPRLWSQQTIVIGVMQNYDNSLTTFTRRRRLGFGRVMDTRQGTGAPSPSYLPEANSMARRVADLVDGIPAAGWNDALGVPISGHLLGGCPIGGDASTGVIDAYHRMHGYPGLHVIDGATVTANLGVNPSLTIAALAERATALWPNAGDPDPRPQLGSPYQRVAAVPPKCPAVPAGAPAELRMR